MGHTILREREQCGMELIGSRLPYGTDLGSFGPFSAFADIGNWYLLARLTHGLPKGFTRSTELADGVSSMRPAVAASLLAVTLVLIPVAQSYALGQGGRG